MQKVLLCPPTSYDIVYEINPWMDTKNKVNKMRVMEEYAALKKTYERLGLEVLQIRQSPDLPDMVYTANLGVPIGNIFIKANFKMKERKKEAQLAKEYFETLGYEITELPDHINWEGQGDLLKLNERFFAGWGKRSDKKAIPYLQKILDTEVISLELIDPYYYHLDTCFTPLDDDTAVINPKAFTSEGLDTFNKEFKNIIEVSGSDNSFLACNSYVFNDNIVVAKGISAELKESYDRFGYKAIEIETDEYRKGGGSVKCLTLQFYS